MTSYYLQTSICVPVLHQVMYLFLSSFSVHSAELYVIYLAILDSLTASHIAVDNLLICTNS